MAATYHHPRRLYIGTTAEMAAAAATLDVDGIGTDYWDTDVEALYIWDGTAWVSAFAALPHDILSATHADTTPAAVVRGDLVTGQGVAPLWARLAHPGAANRVLQSTATEMGWSAGSLVLGGFTLTVPATGTAVIGGGAGVANRVAYWTDANTLASDAGLTYNPATDTLSLANSLTFTGATGVNDITIPDGQQDAFEIVDGTTGDEYLGFRTVAQKIVVVNEDGVDIDFIVEVVGHTDALFVRGSDGQITLGALGAGHLSTDLGGVVSPSVNLTMANLAWIGIAGPAEHIAFDAAGNIAFGGVTSVVVPDGCWVGADAACSWVFNSTLGYVTTLDNVGMGVAAPLAQADVRGKLLTQSWLHINDTGFVDAGSGDTRPALIFGATDDEEAWYLGAHLSAVLADMKIGMYSWGLGGWLQTWQPDGRIGVLTETPSATFDVRAMWSHFGVNDGDLFIRDNTLNFGYSTDANFDGWINYEGFNHGTTQFRDLKIADGKHNVIAFFDGSTGAVKIASLAGVGVRAVVAAADGTLSAP